MTPWLAASAAVVVLAAMAVRAPAAQLTFPFTPGVRCHGANCSLADRPNHLGKGPAGTDAKPGVHLKQPAPRAPADVDPSNSVPSNAAPVNVTLQYKVISTWSGHHFDAQILVTGQRRLGHWNLAFVIPGVTIELVLGGAWQHNAGNDGGIAYGKPWPWARSSANSARLVVFGIGPARFPASCSFDGRSCIFRPGG